MADLNERVGLRGRISERRAQLGGIMGEIRKTRGPAQKKAIKKKAGKWAGKTRSAYSD